MLKPQALCLSSLVFINLKKVLTVFNLVFKALKTDYASKEMFYICGEKKTEAFSY